MRKFIVSQVVAVLSLSSTLLATSVALAEDRECRTTLGKETVTGNLIVPDDATCTLDGTIIQGKVTVKPRAVLTTNGANITNGIQGESAKKIDINPGTFVGNNVSLQKGVEVSIDGANIRGDIQLQENTGSINVTKNNITGNLQPQKNTGGIVISSNTIGNQLQCQENSPPPEGGGNIAEQKEGQCANL